MHREMGEKFQCLRIIPFESDRRHGDAPFWLMVEWWVHALSWNGQRRKDRFGRVNEILKFLKGEKAFQVGGGQKFV